MQTLLPSHTEQHQPGCCDGAASSGADGSGGRGDLLSPRGMSRNTSTERHGTTKRLLLAEKEG